MEDWYKHVTVVCMCVAVECVLEWYVYVGVGYVWRSGVFVGVVCV